MMMNKLRGAVSIERQHYQYFGDPTLTLGCPLSYQRDGIEKKNFQIASACPMCDRVRHVRLTVLPFTFN